jgi:glycosyltransferase involved in cell wall biosynthesis
MDATLHQDGAWRPSISVLAPNAGGPSMGFTMAYARALSEAFPVQILAPDWWGGGVLPMYRGSFDTTVIPTPRLYRFPDFFRQSERLSRAATGDVLMAVKAMPQTVWVALREKRRRGCKVVVCLDEWDGALMARRSPAERRAFWRCHWMHPLEENFYPIVERLLPRADLVISTGTFLQRKFGGIVVRMGADTDRFRPPAPADKAAVRAELGLAPVHRVIVFGGVVRPHKGVEQILEAMRLAGDPAMRLLIVGPLTETVSVLLKGPQGKFIVATGAKPVGEMPRWLGAGDLAVLPMSDDELARSQVPCKVFEAMAMGLPVLAGAVSDLPEIVQGAGAVFDPRDVGGLAEILKSLWGDTLRLEGLGREARRRCVERYSAETMKRNLVAAVAGLR